MRRTVTKDGFTLTEVIMAVALLTIAIVPILKGLTQTNLNSVIIERRTQSLCFAQGKLNRVKAESIYDFNDISTLSNEVLSGSYLCNTTIQTTANPNLKKIIISVGQDQNGNSLLAAGEIEITLHSQIAKRW